VVKRLYEFLAVVMMLGGLGGMGLSFYFLYAMRFIEGFTGGLFGFLLLRAGILVLRLAVAQRALGDAHARILEHVSPRGTPPPR
jgi:hypothetical protein